MTALYEVEEPVLAKAGSAYFWRGWQVKVTHMLGLNCRVVFSDGVVGYVLTAELEPLS